MGRGIEPVLLIDKFELPLVVERYSLRATSPPLGVLLTRRVVVGIGRAARHGLMPLEKIAAETGHRVDRH